MTDELQPPGTWLPGTYLARLSSPVRGELLRLGTKRRIAAGTRIIRQGERESDVYVLRASGARGSACVKVSALLVDGSDTLLAIRMAGDVVGEGAGFRTDGTRGAMVTACTDISVQSLSRTEFDSFLQRRPEAWRALCALLTERQDFANRRRLDFAAFDVRVRLARLVNELALAHGVPAAAGGLQLDFDLSQEELGKLVGAKLDAVGLAIRRLRTEGVLQTRRRGVSIQSMAALRSAAELD